MSDNITISHFVMIFYKCSLVLLYIFVKNERLNTNLKTEVLIVIK